MHSQNQLVAVADKGHLLLAEPPHELNTGIVLGHVKVKAGGIVGILQIGAVQILIGLLHLVGIDDKAGEQGQVRGLGADFLGEQAILLAAVLLLLDQLPPAGDGLTVGEGGGVVVPEGLGRVQGVAVAQQRIIDMRADILGVERGHIAFLVVVEEHIAVYVLHMQNVALNVLGIGFLHAFFEGFVVVQIHDVNGQLRILFQKQVFFLLHLGGGSVDIDGAVCLGLFLCQFVQLFVGHLAPLVVDGAEEVGILGVHIGLTGSGFRVLFVGVACLGGIVLGAAGRKAQHHNQRQKQGQDPFFHFMFSFQNMGCFFAGVTMVPFRRSERTYRFNGPA